MDVALIMQISTNHSTHSQVYEYFISYPVSGAIIITKLLFRQMTARRARMQLALCFYSLERTVFRFCFKFDDTKEFHRREMDK